MKVVTVEVSVSFGRRTYTAKAMYANYEDIRNYLNAMFDIVVRDDAPAWYMSKEGYASFKEACKLFGYEILEHYIEKVEERG